MPSLHLPADLLVAARRHRNQRCTSIDALEDRIISRRIAGMQRDHRISTTGIKIHDGTGLKAQPVKARLLRRRIAIADQLLAHLNADDPGGAVRNIGEVVIERKIQVTLARAHVHDQRPLGLDGLDQRSKNLDHLVDLAELILRIIAHHAIFAGNTQGFEPGLVGGGQRTVLGPVVIG